LAYRPWLGGQDVNLFNELKTKCGIESSIGKINLFLKQARKYY